MHDKYIPYLDRLVVVWVRQFGGFEREAIGIVDDLTDEDLVLCQEYGHGRQCIDYADIISIEPCKIEPEDIYNSLVGD